MITKKEFFNLYNRNSIDNENRNVGIWANVIYRRNIAFKIAYYLAKYNVSANFITLINLIIATFAIAMFAIPTTLTLILLIFIIELVYILDNVDGQLARFHGTFSKYGALLDDFSDLFINAFFAMTFGIRLFLETHNFLFLILGNLGSLSFIFEGLWIKNSDEIIGNFTKDNSASFFYKLRIILLSITDMATITLLILLLTFIQKIIPTFTGVSSLFIIYIFVLFIAKIFLRYVLVLWKASNTNKIIWKGWNN